MKNIPLIFLLFASFLTYSQSKNVPAYYQNINKAEESIVNGKLDSSSKYYTQAFRFLEQPFARDMYNAAIVDAQLKRFGPVTEKIDYLIKLGMPFRTISKQTQFQEFFESEAGKKFAASADKIKAIYDTAYRNEILRMVADDQRLRGRSNSYTTLLDTIQKIDKANVKRLLALIQKKGFPTETKIGLLSDTISAQPLYMVLIVHQNNGPHQQHDFSSLLKEQVALGNLEANTGHAFYIGATGMYSFNLLRVELVRPIDTTRGYLNPNNHVLLETSPWFPVKYNEREVERINYTRRQFFLEDYNVFMKELMFNQQQSMYILGNLHNGSTIVVTKKEDYDQEIANLRRASQ